MLNSNNRNHLTLLTLRDLLSCDMLRVAFKVVNTYNEHNIDIIYFPDHSEFNIKSNDNGKRWILILVSAWKNSVNTTIIYFGFIRIANDRQFNIRLIPEFSGAATTDKVVERSRIDRRTV